MVRFDTTQWCHGSVRFRYGGGGRGECIMYTKTFLLDAIHFDSLFDSNNFLIQQQEQHIFYRIVNTDFSFLTLNIKIAIFLV